MILTRDQILSAVALPRVEVYVPDWGGSVFVRCMTGTERDAFEADHVERSDKEKLQDFHARIVVLTACDEAGNLLFTPADIAAVGRLSAPALYRLVEVSMRLSGFTKADVAELEGKCEASPSAASPSGSPATSA